MALFMHVSTAGGKRNAMTQSKTCAAHSPKRCDKLIQAHRSCVSCLCTGRTRRPDDGSLGRATPSRIPQLGPPVCLPLRAKTGPWRRSANQTMGTEVFSRDITAPNRDPVGVVLLAL
jgi:hypothetical protein